MPVEYSVSHIETPIGILEVRGTSEGVATVAFLDAQPHAMQQSDALAECTSQLLEYFAGDRVAFDSFALHYGATDFQQSVWDALMEVPFGEVVTYGELAKYAGHEGAARAVGTAMNVNPLPIIIPCHRVLPADKSIGEYAFGANRKQWLLSHERGEEILA